MGLSGILPRPRKRTSTSEGATLGQVIAFANQKGGVAKTTTTINLAVAFKEKGFNVLVVDLDPQGNASTGLGIDRKDFVAAHEVYRRIGELKGLKLAYLGDGNDAFRWDNGEGSDAIEGQDGTDTMLFNGAAGAENATLTANGGRLTFFRVQGNVTMDTDGVEIVDFNALGGTDNVTVNDLTGTDVTQTNLDLASALGGSAADGALDSVVVNGTNGDDNIDITGNGSGADVTGLATAVSVKHADPTDSLSVNTLAGTDNVRVNGVAGVLQLLVDGAAV